MGYAHLVFITEKAMEIVLTIPDDVAVSLQNGGSKPISMSVLELIAVDGYKTEKLTSPQIQALLGVDRFELDGILKAHGVFFEYSPEELAREADISRFLFEARAA